MAGRWIYLYRAIDSDGNTIDFRLSLKRDDTAAKTFLRLALSRAGAIRPRVINVDGHPAYPRVIKELKRTGESGRQCRCRPSRYMTAFALAVLLAATYGGLGPGLLAIGLSIGLVELLFAKSLAFSLLPGQPSLWFFGFLGTAISIAVDRIRRHNRTLTSTKELLEASNAELAQRSNDLIQSNEKLTRIAYAGLDMAAIVEGSEDAIISKDLHGALST